MDEPKKIGDSLEAWKNLQIECPSRNLKITKQECLARYRAATKNGSALAGMFQECGDCVIGADIQTEWVGAGFDREQELRKQAEKAAGAVRNHRPEKPRQGEEDMKKKGPKREPCPRCGEMIDYRWVSRHLKKCGVSAGAALAGKKKTKRSAASGGVKTAETDTVKNVDFIVKNIEVEIDLGKTSSSSLIELSRRINDELGRRI